MVETGNNTSCLGEYLTGPEGDGVRKDWISCEDGSTRGVSVTVLPTPVPSPDELLETGRKVSGNGLDPNGLVSSAISKRKLRNRSWNYRNAVLSSAAPRWAPVVETTRIWSKE
jgi:hypothetical protein